MELQLNDSLIQVIILDISGVYVQIHNQGYFDKSVVDEIKEQYSDGRHWYVVVIEK